MKFDFLKSRRFIALVAGAFVLFLFQSGLISEAAMTFFGTIIGGFITIRSLDRSVDALAKKADTEIDITK